MYYDFSWTELVKCKNVFQTTNFHQNIYCILYIIYFWPSRWMFWKKTFHKFHIWLMNIFYIIEWCLSFCSSSVKSIDCLLTSVSAKSSVNIISCAKHIYESVHSISVTLIFYWMHNDTNIKLWDVNWMKGIISNNRHDSPMVITASSFCSESHYNVTSIGM